MHKSLLATAVLLLSVSAAQSQSRPTVVELYTSEGCSSCPPAEGLIGKLARQEGVIALSFHVDYWDSLGWRDRFALPDAVARQEQYARTLRLSSVYTPQLVIDGRRDTLGSDERGIAAAIARPQPGAPIKLAIQGDSLVIQLGEQRQTEPQDVLLLAYLPEATSKVTRGENAGRELQEFNIVRSVRKLGAWTGSARQFSVPLSTLPADAAAVALLVQAAGQGAISGAVARALR